MTIMTQAPGGIEVTDVEAAMKRLETMLLAPARERQTVPGRKLPKDIKTAWLAALRSPNLYQQIRGAWAAGTTPDGVKRRCAMGVLDEVVMSLRGGHGIIGLGCNCPEHVDRLGSMLGMQPLAFETLTHEIIGQNDSMHYSFERIAQYIEAKW